MGGNLVLFIGFVILLFLSAFSSAAETALTSVSRIKIKHLAEEEQVSRAKVLNNLLNQPARYLSTILLLNNLVNIAAASVATVIVNQYFRHYVAAISTGIVTFLVLIYGEISPKTFATQNAERISLSLARSISYLSIVLFPVARIFIFIANLFTRLLGGKTMKEGPFLTEEEIKTLVSVGQEDGVIEKEEKEMIHSIFEFGDTIVKEVMVPRMDMVCVEDTAFFKDVLDLVLREGYSRIPVFQGSRDNIMGIVYARDLLIHLGQGKKENIPVKKISRGAFFIPETKKVSELLRELQAKRQHIAIVVDEYGGTAGLVTIEDLLEEIVGEIFDEYDSEEVLIEPVDKSHFRVDARVSLDEINETLGVDLPEAEYETIGGFVYSLFGKIPKAGEKIEFNNLVFRIEKVERRRISKILITKKPEEEEDKN